MAKIERKIMNLKNPLLKKFYRNLTIAQRNFFAVIAFNVDKRSVFDQKISVHGKISEAQIREWAELLGYIIDVVNKNDTHVTLRIGKLKQAS